MSNTPSSSSSSSLPELSGHNPIITPAKGKRGCSVCITLVRREEPCLSVYDEAGILRATVCASCITTAAYEVEKIRELVAANVAEDFAKKGA